MTEWEFSNLHQIADPKVQELDREKARTVFVTQLGPRWNGVNALPKHAKALYAAFALFIVGDRKEGERVLRKMAKTFAEGEKEGGIRAGLKAMDTSFVDAALAKHGDHPLLRRVLTQHAYVFTVMATMLQIARSAGVLASAMFIWLKPVDRRLWYTLNNTGRYAFHVECAGIMAHWLWEKTVGEACPTPMVEKALDGLSMALKEYCEDDSEDRMFL
jgi:intracellular multiplication protein IcmP